METIVFENELLPVITETGIETATANILIERFTPFIEQVNEWKEKAESLVVTDISQVGEMKMAREARLQLKNIRILADKTRKELKEDSLRYGRAVQSVYNVIEAAISPIEQHLEDQEKFKERYEKQQRDILRIERELLSKEFKEYMFANIDLGDITQVDFDKMLTGAKLQKEAAEQRLKQQEEERIAREKQDAEERERLRIENERLRKESEEREAEIKAEREKNEMAQRKANMEAARIRKEAEKKAADEMAERQRLEAELRDIQLAKEREEAEKQAAIEAELSKGDKEKMLDLIKALGELPFKYSFKSKKHNQIHKAIIDLVEKTTNYATSKL